MQTLPKTTGTVNPAIAPSERSAAYRRAPGDADETTITIDHTTRTAGIWTTRRSIVRRLIRLGATQEGRVGPGVWLRIPAGAIRFRNPQKRAVSEATRARLIAMAGAARGELYRRGVSHSKVTDD